MEKGILKRNRSLTFELDAVFITVFLGIVDKSLSSWASLVAQRVANLLMIQEAQALSQGREDPLEKGTTAHSSVLGWRISWTEDPGGLQFMGSERVRHGVKAND